jgi:hypothetical protein
MTDLDEARRAASRPRARYPRMAGLAAAALVMLLGAAVAVGASPAMPADGTTGVPEAAAPDGYGPMSPVDGERAGPGRHGMRGPVVGPITVTSISGSSVGLATADGWTRTIAVGETTTITKAGESVGLAGLKVGDTVRLRQVRADDGTFSVAAIDIVVLLPRVVGTVTAKDGSTLTLSLLDGTTATVHVDGSTTYQVRGVDSAGLADVAVGMHAMVVGTRSSDGSIEADAIRAGTGPGRMGDRPNGFGFGSGGREGHGPGGLGPGGFGPGWGITPPGAED